MVPSTSEDCSEAEVLHDPHDYDEVPVEEMASRPPMPVPAPSDVYSEVRGGERGRGREREGELHVHTGDLLCVLPQLCEPSLLPLFLSPCKGLQP